MPAKIHSNAGHEVLPSANTGPSRSSSELDGGIQTSESLSNLPSHDSQPQQQFQGVSDIPLNCMRGDQWTPALYQAEPYSTTADLHVDQQVPPNCVLSDPTEANQDDPNTVGSFVGSSMELSINESPTASNTFGMLTNIHSNAAEEVLMSAYAGPSSSSSEFDDGFQISESFANLPSYDSQELQLFQGINDIPNNWIGGELLTPALYQADHYPTADLNMDQQVPPNLVRNDPAQANQNDKKIIPHDADEQTEEFPHPRACEPSGSGLTKIQAGVKQFKCQECGYETSYRYCMKIHVRKHTGEKPYKCKLCSYESAQKVNLKRHTRKHNGEKPYKCELCSYESARKCNLNVHMRKHTGEKPYKCELCSYESAQKSHLNEHMRRRHQCQFCNYKSVTRIELKSHMQNHHRQP